MAKLWVPIDTCHRTCGPIWASQAIQTDDEKPGHVEGTSCTTDQRTPPVTNVCAPRQCMAYDHSVVAILGELSPGAVRDRYIVQYDSGLKGEGRYDGDLLIRYQGGKRVLGLAGGFLYGI